MNAATVWAALRVDNDDLAAGPFSSRTEVERVMQTDEFDDVYPAEVDREWFEQRWAEIQGRPEPVATSRQQAAQNVDLLQRLQESLTKRFDAEFGAGS